MRRDKQPFLLTIAMAKLPSCMPGYQSQTWQ